MGQSVKVTTAVLCTVPPAPFVVAEMCAVPASADVIRATATPPLVTESLRRVQATVQNNGASVLVVEQKVREVLKIADRVYVLRNGRVSFSGP